MPKALEAKLEREASAKGLSGARKDAYVYGTLRKTGWKPSREEHSPANMVKRETGQHSFGQLMQDQNRINKTGGGI